MKKVYIMENIDCANCAAKIEKKIAELPGVNEAVITFATKQLRLDAENPEELLPQIQKIARSVEPDVIITERSRSHRSKGTSARGDFNRGDFVQREAHSHLHGEGCCCGHEHVHDTECSCGHEHDMHEHSGHSHVNTCSCGQEHMEHIHNKTCDCGHEHGTHEHEETCSCGHEHEAHEHKEACSCGHQHNGQDGHSHDGGCSCGHEHNEQSQGTACNCDKHLHSASTSEAAEAHGSEYWNPEAKQSSSDTTEQPASPARSKRKHILSGHGKELLPILAGAALFIIGEILEHMNQPLAAFIAALAAYIILGGRIILTALKNLRHGQIFDENFLMSIATIGAFCIQEYLEAVGVMLFYRIGEFFEHVAVERSRSQIMDAVDLRPEVVSLVTGQNVQVIDAEEANVGDILLVRPGDRIPLDGIVVEGESRIDTSPVTGEPVPVRAAAGDAVTSGCVNTSGQLKIRVEKILEESMVTRILDSVENAAAGKPKIDRFITRFARIYTPFVILLALGTAIIPSLISGNWNYWVYTALTFLVMSCPCALVLSVPLAFFSGIGAGSRRGILFKGGVSLEAIRNIKTVIMDKTGTITQGNFKVQKVIPAQGFTEQEVLSLCACCEMSSTHPIAVSIVTAADAQNLQLDRPSSVEEIAGHGIRAVTRDGEVLCGSRKLLEECKVDLSSYAPADFGTEVLAAKNGKYIGYIVISDTIKADAHHAVSTLKAQGITPVMLTGDSEESAASVARETGITEVHARLLPEDKLNELSKIRSTHGAVMFVGDGINDAPVLAGADVGAAMGSGADAAIEAADVVFMTSKMEAVPQAISIARRTNSIALQNIVFALIIKAIVMVLGLCGYASMWMAVFADTGVAMLCVLNSIRALYGSYKGSKL